MKINTKQLVFMAFLIALKVVLTRFLGIHIGEFIRISFSFIATAIMAVYFGPLLTGVGCGIADALGAILFPRGAYFFGFTLSAMIIGLIYGMFLYKKHFSWWRIIVIKVLVLVLITAGLNSMWLAMLSGKGYMPLMIARVTEGLIMLPIEVMMLGMVQKYLIPQLKKNVAV
ncbi:MAG: folate family ECF transporter S component [Cellulosilyticaceae bacterium]